MVEQNINAESGLKHFTYEVDDWKVVITDARTHIEVLIYHKGQWHSSFRLPGPEATAAFAKVMYELLDDAGYIARRQAAKAAQGAPGSLLEALGILPGRLDSGMSIQLTDGRIVFGISVPADAQELMRDSGFELISLHVKQCTNNSPSRSN